MAEAVFAKYPNSWIGSSSASPEKETMQIKSTKTRLLDKTTKASPNSWCLESSHVSSQGPVTDITSLPPVLAPVLVLWWSLIHQCESLVHTFTLHQFPSNRLLESGYYWSSPERSILVIRLTHCPATEVISTTPSLIMHTFSTWPLGCDSKHWQSPSSLRPLSKPVGLLSFPVLQTLPVWD